MKCKLSYIILLLINSLYVKAEIILDGTLGRSGALPGPDYLIGANLGRQHGGNLFHSFQNFNLKYFENATFSGPNSVSNIISRVTGGNPSQIDGLIRSTIPNADMYFLNPYGIMFGPNAKLDVQGGFHASTADYLRLGENGRFDARNPNGSLLTVAPIESFGFLTDSPAAIQVTDSHLEVLPTQTLSLTGGDLSFTNNQTPIYDEAANPIFPHQLVAPNGHIILNTQGMVNLQNFGVDTSGLFGGQISIRGSQLEMNDSRISSHTFGALDGQAIDIQVDNLLMQDSDIIANTYGAGHGSAINIQVNEDLVATRIDQPLGIEFGVSLHGSSHITTLTAGQGDIGASGDITIQAGNIDLRHAAEIRSRSFSQAKSGNITLRVADTFQAVGVIPLNTETLPIISGVHTFSFANGDSGNIEVFAQHIILDEGGEINAATLGSGQGGSVFAQADTIQIKEQGKLLGIPTGIGSASMGSGQTGQVKVDARQITLENGGTISTNSFLSGESNELTVTVSDTLTISGVAKLPYQILGLPEVLYPSNISSGSINTGADGGLASNVHVQAKHIILDAGGTIASLTYGGSDGGNAEVIADIITISGWKNNGVLYRSGINNSSISLEAYAGLSGNIDITANKIMISDGGAINTSAMNAGGGNIAINVKDIIHLSDQGRITTSVQSGIGDGGNIDITNPLFTVLNQGQITAQADEGRGGNIRIAAENFITSPDSLVNASSKLGIDGNVKIDSPDTDVERFFAVLPGSFIESNQLESPCNSKIGENQSRFTIVSSEGTSNVVGDLLPSAPLLSQIKPMTGKNTMAKPAVKVALLAGCQPNLSAPPARIGTTYQAAKRSHVIPEEPLF